MKYPNAIVEAVWTATDRANRWLIVKVSAAEDVAPRALIKPTTLKSFVEAVDEIVLVTEMARTNLGAVTEL